MFSSLAGDSPLTSPPSLPALHFWAGRVGTRLGLLEHRRAADPVHWEDAVAVRHGSCGQSLKASPPPRLGSSGPELSVVDRIIHLGTQLLPHCNFRELAGACHAASTTAPIHFSPNTTAHDRRYLGPPG
jgi:hypothetical protein